MNLKEAENFLKEVKKISSQIPKQEKTFMEISGYPYYENSYSNILAFYFNPKEEHGLNDIMLKSLLEIVKEKNNKLKTNVNLSNTSVFREYTTELGNRIDLVLQNDEIVIGIENKVMADVTNNLKDYANTLEKINSNAVKILLSLYDESIIAKENDFINITYSELFYKIRLNLKDYVDIQNKWYIYLTDFMKNLEGDKIDKDMEEIIKEWIKIHQEEINEFYELLNLGGFNLDEKMEEYIKKMSLHYKVGKWNDREVPSGAYILFGNLGYNLDVVLSASGWKVRLNLWKNQKRMQIKRVLQEKNYNILREEQAKGRNYYVYLYEFDYNYSVDELISKVLDIINSLNAVE